MRKSQRESGYMAQAIPTAMTTNSAKDHAAYLTRSAAVRCVRHASAKDASAAKISSVEKWLRGSAVVCNQLLRPDAISQASQTLIRFTIPAAAIKRVP
jgi:hypothetical protein